MNGLTGDSHEAYARPRVGGDNIGTLVEVINQMVKSCATNADIAMVTSETGRFRKVPNEPAIQFEDAFLLKDAK